MVTAATVSTVDATAQIYHRVIVVGRTTWGGAWGGGGTIAEAKANFRKSGGKQPATARVLLFVSNLPFAPWDRDAEPGECDAYVSQSGACVWDKCERIEL